MIDPLLQPEVVALAATDREAIGTLLNDHVDLYADRAGAITEAVSAATATQALLVDEVAIGDDPVAGVQVAALLAEMNIKTAARSAFWTSLFQIAEGLGFLPETVRFEWDYEANDFALSAHPMER